MIFSLASLHCRVDLNLKKPRTNRPGNRLPEEQYPFRSSSLKVADWSLFLGGRLTPSNPLNEFPQWARQILEVRFPKQD